MQKEPTDCWDPPGQGATFIEASRFRKSASRSAFSGAATNTLDWGIIVNSYGGSSCLQQSQSVPAG